MRPIFSEILWNKIDANSIFKKAIIRVFAICLSFGLLISAISYLFFSAPLITPKNSMFLYFVIFISVFIGGFCGALVFGNILIHIKRIIRELSNDNPRWESLEREYCESEIRSEYEGIKKLHLSVSSQSKRLCGAQIAAQVSHDLHSPLVGLDLMIQNLSNIPEEQRNLLKNATSRIYEIANNLLVQYQNKSIKSNDDPFIINTDDTQQPRI